MNVTLYNTQKDLLISTESVEKLVLELLKYLKISCDEIIVHLVSEKKICLVHKKFFNDPTSTDCISFPIDSPHEQQTPPVILGEVFICPKVAIQYAKKNQLDPYEEASRYLVHGTLHFLGFDDIEPDDRAVMRAKEDACVLFLKEKKRLLCF